MRTRLTSPSVQFNTDEGSAQYSLKNGELQRDRYTVRWAATNIDDWEIEVVATAFARDAAGAFSIHSTATSITLQTEKLAGTKTFDLIVPESLGDSHPDNPAPGPTGSVYYCFSMKIQDGTDLTKTQVWIPLTGIIEIQYATTSTS